MVNHNLPEPKDINLDPSKNRWPAPETVFSSDGAQKKGHAAAHLIITYLPTTLTVEDLTTWWKARPELSEFVIANIDSVYDAEHNNKPVGAWPIILKTPFNGISSRVEALINCAVGAREEGPFKEHFECTAIHWKEPVQVTPFDETGLAYVVWKRRLDKVREKEEQRQAEEEAKAAKK